MSDAAENKPYFEDIEIGDTERSISGRTITETDVVNFAMFSGDWNPLHTDEEFAKKTPFEQRIAHGMLGLAVSTGMRRDAPLPHIMAFLHVSVDFKKPIFIGDTVRVEAEVVEKRETKKVDRGIVIYARRLVNQRDEVVQDARFTLMIRRRGSVV